MDKKTLTANLHRLGVKTYRKKSTGQSFVKCTDISLAAGKWEPDADDLYDYANNVESLYNELQKLKRKPSAIKDVAETIIEEYNIVCEDYPERIYKGSVEELIMVIEENEELN